MIRYNLNKMAKKKKSSVLQEKYEEKMYEQKRKRIQYIVCLRLVHNFSHILLQCTVKDIAYIK